MENEEFLGPKTGHRSGPGGPGVARMVAPLWIPTGGTRENIPAIPGLIGVTAHHLCSALLLRNTKTSWSRVVAHVTDTLAGGHSWLWSFSRVSVQYKAP